MVAVERKTGGEQINFRWFLVSGNILVFTKKKIILTLSLSLCHYKQCNRIGGTP